MDDQGSTIDEAFGQAAEPIDEGKVPIMNQRDHESFDEAPAASLVGSLSVFSLSDILSMLASTKQSGELQVVSEGTDGKLWLADGELSNAQVGVAATIGQAVFELACVTDGWFYFTVGVVSSSGQPTVPVLAVLNEVRPQVDEWREIRRDVPLEAVVTLAPDPPGEDVQIRSDQWRVLTTVGTSGHSVRTVLEQIGGDHIAGLRSLRDLQAAGLIELDHGASAQDTSDIEPGSVPPIDPGADLTSLPAPPDLAYPGVDETDDFAAAPPPADNGRPSNDGHDTLAEVAVMPPPIAADPWTPSVETGASDNGVA
jgi:hypothetical protein